MASGSRARTRPARPRRGRRARTSTATPAASMKLSAERSSTRRRGRVGDGDLEHSSRLAERLEIELTAELHHDVEVLGHDEQRELGGIRAVPGSRPRPAGGRSGTESRSAPLPLMTSVPSPGSRNRGRNRRAGRRPPSATERIVDRAASIGTRSSSCVSTMTRRTIAWSVTTSRRRRRRVCIRCASSNSSRIPVLSR